MKASALEARNEVKSGQPDLALLLEPVAPEMQLVNQWLETNMIDDSAFLSQLLKEIFKSGGKRIRPALVLLSARATLKDREFSRLQITLAVLTELIHTASLVHDDVIDRSDMRRGQETVNKRWSDKLAVLVGDLLFAQASICLSRLMNPQIVGIYGQVLGDLCAGEMKQMNSQFNTAMTFDDYVQKSIGKTASLFAAGCHSAPILNGCDDHIIGKMKDYGLNLGIAFQIVDDLLDFTSSQQELGKPAGSDLASGTITAPAIFVLQDGTKSSERLKELIKNRQVSSGEGLAEALSIIKENGGIERTKDYARGFAEKSMQALEAINDSVYKKSLKSIVDFIISRSY